MDAIIGGFTGEPEVATVNGNDITEREFLRTVQLKPSNLMQMENPDPSLVDEDQIAGMFGALIQEAVLTQGRQPGLELSDADIDSDYPDAQFQWMASSTATAGGMCVTWVWVL